MGNAEIVESAFELILASQACSVSSEGGLDINPPFGILESLT